MLMLAKIDDESNLSKLTLYRPDIKTSNELDQEIKTELLNAIVYSSDEVVKRLSDFMNEPKRESFYEVASAIRKDLWGEESRLSSELKSVLSMV